MNRLLILLLLIPGLAFGSHTITRKKRHNGVTERYYEEVRVAWQAESGGNIPEIPVTLFGEMIGVEVEPGWSAYGGSAPTDNYDIALYKTQNGVRYDIFSGGGIAVGLTDLDFNTLIHNVPTTFINTPPAYEHYVTVGTVHYLAITGNTNASANGSVVFYMCPGHGG